MRLMLYIFFLFIGRNVYSACNGATGKLHVNPDGSTGGFVSSGASVSASVYVDESSSVCDLASLRGNVKVSRGSVILGNARIEGNSEISYSTIRGNAKIFGNAIVRNSIVCQESLINFKVIDSSYYCSIFEPEPKNPGLQGRATLKGIDSNVNGIRDDVELWINSITTNSPSKSLDSIRSSLYEAAKELQIAIVFNSQKEKSRVSYLNSFRGLNCISKHKDAVISELPQKMKIEVFNTQARLEAWFNINSYLAGVNLKDIEVECIR